MSVMDGLLNVRDFGATGNGFANDRVAIQNAIDSASSADHPHGAVIYFPEGRYLVTDGSLTLPRLPTFNEPNGPRTLVFKGAGWMVSTVINGNPQWGDPNNPVTNVPLFVADPDPGDNHGARGYGFEDLHLGDGTNNQEVFVWDVPPPPGGTWNADQERYRVEAFFHRVIFSSRRNLVGPDRYLVRLHGGSRTRFLNCLFYGLGFDSPSNLAKDHHGGAAMKIWQSGGITLTDCHTLFAGAMLDVQESGEILVSNSRSEGGYGRPAWNFVASHNITLIDPANEGRLENPSIFYFRQCRDIVLMNPQFAGPGPIEEVGGLKRYADVLQFEDCENCRVIGGHIYPVKGRNIKGVSEIVGSDGTARLIRVKNTTDVSRYIVGENVPSVTYPAEKDTHIDAGAQYCCFELWGQHPDVNRVVKIGDCPTQDQMIWINPLHFVVSEGAPGWETLSISRGFSGNTIRVKSQAPGDVKWIALPLPIPTNLKIKKLTVCYQVSNPRSFISQIRLSEEKEPPSATVIHDDPTDLTSTTPACYESTVGFLQPGGAITLSLRLNFGDASDHIDIGAVGVLVGS